MSFVSNIHFHPISILKNFKNTSKFFQYWKKIGYDLYFHPYLAIINNYFDSLYHSILLFISNHWLVWIRVKIFFPISELSNWWNSVSKWNATLLFPKLSIKKDFFPCCEENEIATVLLISNENINRLQHYLFNFWFFNSKSPKKYDVYNRKDNELDGFATVKTKHNISNQEIKAIIKQYKKSKLIIKTNT